MSYWTHINVGLPKGTEESENKPASLTVAMLFVIQGTGRCKRLQEYNEQWQYSAIPDVNVIQPNSAQSRLKLRRAMPFYTITYPHRYRHHDHHWSSIFLLISSNINNFNSANTINNQSIIYIYIISTLFYTHETSVITKLSKSTSSVWCQLCQPPPVTRLQQGATNEQLQLVVSKELPCHWTAPGNISGGRLLLYCTEMY